MNIRRSAWKKTSSAESVCGQMVVVCGEYAYTCWYTSERSGQSTKQSGMRPRGGMTNLCPGYGRGGGRGDAGRRDAIAHTAFLGWRVLRSCGYISAQTIGVFPALTAIFGWAHSHRSLRARCRSIYTIWQFLNVEIPAPVLLNTFLGPWSVPKTMRVE